MNLRLVALGGVVACVLALPLAMASAGSKGAVGDEGRAVAGAADAGEAEGAADGVGGAAGRTDPKAPRVGRSPSAPDSPSPSASPLLGLGLATAARCGPELTSPDGVEAQTCVLTQGADTWARTYYRNATGRALNAVLSLMGPEGRTVQTRCAVGAEDEPDACETPRERTRGALDGYSAVTEFAGAVGEGPLLLRSGSNS
ncbi:hypothetical protein [Streptomyces antibioticus]|uniref:hypothetical protein n=1 Tax=Streptomyces antibioticus TaxID=1890 RepID=UPI00224E32B3|nr:hypothetical protein [Streptomyces antibioticus]MCX4738085.1 hypothetical protein [Streptomyces antibioticus]